MSLSRTTLHVFVGVVVAWTLTWAAKVRVLDGLVPWLMTGAGSFTFWTVAKVIVWIVPAVMLVRLSRRSIREVLSVHRPASWLAWGAGSGLAVALTAVVPRWLAEQPLITVHPGFDVLNALVVAPLFEEFLLRGAVLGNFRRDHSFATANAWASLLFLGLHVPGWFFMGSLRQQFLQPVGGAVSIILLGLVFGYAVHRSRSVLGGVVAHALNNLASLG